MPLTCIVGRYKSLNALAPRDWHQNLPGPLYLTTLQVATGYCRLSPDYSGVFSLDLLTTQHKLINVNNPNRLMASTSAQLRPAELTEHQRSQPVMNVCLWHPSKIHLPGASMCTINRAIFSEHMKQINNFYINKLRNKSFFIFNINLNFFHMCPQIAQYRLHPSNSPTAPQSALGRFFPGFQAGV